MLNTHALCSIHSPAFSLIFISSTIHVPEQRGLQVEFLLGLRVGCVHVQV